MDLIPSPETHHHGGHAGTGRRWLDVVLGVSAVAISLFSAVMTLQHGHAMEKMVDQNARMVQANTWPYVTIADSNGDAEGNALYRISVMNNGVGPAKVETLEMLYHGRRMNDVFDLARQIAKNDGEVLPAAVQGSDIGGVLPARQTVAILTVQRPNSSAPLIAAFLRARSDIEVRACYCSIFEDCWMTSSIDASPPRPVTSCSPRRRLT